MGRAGKDFFIMSMFLCETERRENLGFETFFPNKKRFVLFLGGILRLSLVYYGYASPLSLSDAVLLVGGNRSTPYLKMSIGMMKANKVLIKSGYKDRYILAPEYAKLFEQFIIKQERQYNTFLAEQRKKYPSK